MFFFKKVQDFTFGMLNISYQNATPSM